MAYGTALSPQQLQLIVYEIKCLVWNIKVGSKRFFVWVLEIIDKQTVSLSWSFPVRLITLLLVYLFMAPANLKLLFSLSGG